MSKLPYGSLICTLVQGVTFPVQTRVVPAYLKVVRHMRPSMPKNRDLGEHKRSPLVGSVCETSPEKKILTASLFFLNALFPEFGTRFQSFLVKSFLLKNARNNLPS